MSSIWIYYWGNWMGTWTLAWNFFQILLFSQTWSFWHLHFHICHPTSKTLSLSPPTYWIFFILFYSRSVFTSKSINTLRKVNGELFLVFKWNIRCHNKYSIKRITISWSSVPFFMDHGQQEIIIFVIFYSSTDRMLQFFYKCLTNSFTTNHSLLVVYVLSSQN